MNPLTWQNPEQLFVAQVLKKIFYNSVAELRINLKNGDSPIVFKRKSICDFFDKINTFFDVKSETPSNSTHPVEEDGKIKSITEEELLKQLRPLIKISSPHTLEAISVAEKFYEGKYPKMTMRDWLQLVKNID